MSTPLDSVPVAHDVIVAASGSAADVAVGSRRKRKATSSSTAAGSDEQPRPTPMPQAKKHQTAKTEQPAEFVVADGLRYVRPYPFEFSCYVKKRWWGASLLEMLSAEYKNPHVGYYERLLACGRITVTPAGRSRRPITEPEALRAHRIQSNDLVAVRMHRHEPAVSAQTIEILHHAPAAPIPNAAAISADAVTPCPSQPHETIVVNKPAGIPVHASGRYFWNTIVGILKSEHGIDAMPVHRLDRVTSGLLLLSLTRSNSVALGREFSERLVRKEYVARVRGEFPTGTRVVRGAMQLRGMRRKNTEEAAGDAPQPDATASTTDAATAAPTAAVSASVVPANPFMSPTVPARMHASTSSQGSVDPVAADPPADAAADPDSSKTSSTEFERISFDGCTSLVRCRPLTGRTHQIRLHLSSIGFPIANDFLYGGGLFASNTYADAAHRVMNAAHVPWDDACTECDQGRAEIARDMPNTNECGANNVACATSSSPAAITPSTAPAASSDSASSAQPPLYCSSIWLHCYSYSGPNWSYASPMPPWAADEFDSAAALAQPVHTGRDAADDDDKNEAE